MPIPLHWHTEPLLLLSLILVGWLYALGIGPFRHYFAQKQPYPLLKGVAFYSGLIFLYLAVGSPVDQLGEDFLFSVHMIQHMLLIYVSPPLFLVGLPHWLIDPLFKKISIRRIFHFLTHPVSAGILFSLLFALWHIPVLYEAALRDKAIHVLEHYLIFFPALLMWWPILSPSRILPPRNYGVRILYIFLLMVAQLPVFGALTLSQEVIYPTYEFAPRIIDITPLQDQILGGIIMKVTNMLVSLIVLTASFIYWYRETESQSDSAV